MAEFNELLVPGQQIWIVGVAIPPVAAAVSASNDLTAPLTYTATGLPHGVSMDTSGVFTGTPTIPSTATSIAVTVTDANGIKEFGGFEYIVVSDLADSIERVGDQNIGVSSSCVSISNIPDSPTLAVIIANATAAMAVAYP